MRLTQRDVEIIDFLKRVVVADTQTLLKIFFQLRFCFVCGQPNHKHGNIRRVYPRNSACLPQIERSNTIELFTRFQA